MDDRHPVITTVATLTAIATAAFSTWWTIIAFVGGTMPIIGVETDGGFGYGLFWLFIVDPIVITVAWWVSVVVVSPFLAGAAMNERRRRDDLYE